MQTSRAAFLGAVIVCALSCTSCISDTTPLKEVPEKYRPRVVTGADVFQKDVLYGGQLFWAPPADLAYGNLDGEPGDEIGAVCLGGAAYFSPDGSLKKRVSFDDKGWRKGIKRRFRHDVTISSPDLKFLPIIEGVATGYYTSKDIGNLFAALDHNGDATLTAEIEKDYSYYFAAPCDLDGDHRFEYVVHSIPTIRALNAEGNEIWRRDLLPLSGEDKTFLGLPYGLLTDTYATRTLTIHAVIGHLTRATDVFALSASGEVIKQEQLPISITSDIAFLKHSESPNPMFVGTMADNGNQVVFDTHTNKVVQQYDLPNWFVPQSAYVRFNPYDDPYFVTTMNFGFQEGAWAGLRLVPGSLVIFDSKGVVVYRENFSNWIEAMCVVPLGENKRGFLIATHEISLDRKTRTHYLIRYSMK